MEEPQDTQEQDGSKIETIVKVCILIWSAALLSLSYYRPPNGGDKIVDFDPTFIASIFAGASSSLGLSIGKKNGNGKKLPETTNSTKK